MVDLVTIAPTLTPAPQCQRPLTREDASELAVVEAQMHSLRSALARLPVDDLRRAKLRWQLDGATWWFMHLGGESAVREVETWRERTAA